MATNDFEICAEMNAAFWVAWRDSDSGADIGHVPCNKIEELMPAVLNRLREIGVAQHKEA